MGNDPLYGEGPRGFQPLGGTEDGGHDPQISMGWYMGVTTNWGGAGNGGSGRDQDIYCLPPEHGCTIN